MQILSVIPDRALYMTVTDLQQERYPKKDTRRKIPEEGYLKKDSYRKIPAVRFPAVRFPAVRFPAVRSRR
jgi:hypothetical protein